MCNKPLKAYSIGLKPNGKQNIVFNRKDLLPYQLANAKEIELPCGRCIACRIAKTAQWGMRAEHEAKFHDDNCFITLTYAPENLPNSLVKRPLQLFIKRLRKALKHVKIKYIASGELGDNYDNPHYHICTFGFDPPDKQKLFEKEGKTYYTSKFIESLWGYGFVMISDLNYNTARYTAKYAIKKELGVKEKTRPAEFFVCSQGIAEAHVNKYAKDMATKGSTYVNKSGCALPRYYKEKIKNTEYKDILESRLNVIKTETIKKYNSQVEKGLRTWKTNQDKEVILTRKLELKKSY